MRLAPEPKCRECGELHERCPQDCGIVTDDCEGGPCPICRSYGLTDLPKG